MRNQVRWDYERLLANHRDRKKWFTQHRKCLRREAVELWDCKAILLFEYSGTMPKYLQPHQEQFSRGGKTEEVEIYNWLGLLGHGEILPASRSSGVKKNDLFELVQPLRISATSEEPEPSVSGLARFEFQAPDCTRMSERLILVLIFPFSSSHCLFFSHLSSI